VPALVALVNSAFRGDAGRAGWTTEADLLGGIRIDAERMDAAIAAAEVQAILVHERDSRIVACVHLRQAGGDCHLGMLTTEPAMQGTGLGRRMVATAEHWAVERWRSRRMLMTVLLQRPELVAWYGRLGYVTTGEQRPFPYGDERWGLPKRSDLAFLVLRKPL
jgi:GNAT superfamily N-acetyltransferase